MSSTGAARRSAKKAASFSAGGTWSPGLLELATTLSLVPQADIRRRATELFITRPRLAEAQARPELFRLTASLLRVAAADMAVALGTTPAEVLQFCSPFEQSLALEGRFNTNWRLDRALGGTPLATLEARRPMNIRWLGPGMGRFFVLRGEARANERIARANEMLLAPVGAAVHIAAGGLVLVRNPLVSTLLEISRNAGLDLDNLMAEAASPDVSAETPLGRLWLSEGHAMLGSRRVRLSTAEAAVLRTLAAAGGSVVPRAELAEAARLRTKKSLEHILVDLRDKLGDGLITSVYGVGCALEVR